MDFGPRKLLDRPQAARLLIELRNNGLTQLASRGARLVPRWNMPMASIPERPTTARTGN